MSIQPSTVFNVLPRLVKGVLYGGQLRYSMLRTNCTPSLDLM